MQVNLNRFQQERQQQQVQLPFDQQVHYPVSSLPLLTGLSVSPNMQQFLPHVIRAAVEEIQNKAGTTWSRTFFFNLIGDNGFNNQMFADFVRELCSVIELVLMTTQQGIEQTIASCAEEMTVYAVSITAKGNPNLINALISHGQQSTVAQMDMCIRTHREAVTRMRQAVQAEADRQRSGNGGYSTQTQPSMGVTMATPTHHQAAFSSGPTSYFAGSPRPLNDPAGSGRASVQVASLDRPSDPAVIDVQPRPPRSVPLQAASASTQVRGRSGNVVPIAASGASTSTRLSSLEPVGPLRVVEVIDASAAAWIPSSKFPQLPAYDPNVETLKFHIYSDGTIEPLITPNPTMDRSEHLKPLTITPTLVATLHGLHVSSGATDPAAHVEITPADLHSIPYPNEEAEITMNHKENWFLAEGCMLAQRSKFPDTVAMAVKHSVVIDPIMGSSAVRDLIGELCLTQNAAQASVVLRNVENAAMKAQNLLDLRAISRLKRRLVDRVNRFVRHDMSMSYGTITDFVTDWPELPGWFKTKIGQSAYDLLIDAHKRIVLEAVGLIDAKRLEQLGQTRFKHLAMPEQEDLHVLPLAEYIAYGVVDMSSIELRAEIPAKTKESRAFSVMIAQNHTPVLHKLVSQLCDRAKGEQLFGNTPQRYLLRTRDGVVLEVGPGAFNTGEFVVSVNQAGELDE